MWKILQWLKDRGLDLARAPGKDSKPSFPNGLTIDGDPVEVDATATVAAVVAALTDDVVEELLPVSAPGVLPLGEIDSVSASKGAAGSNKVVVTITLKDGETVPQTVERRVMLALYAFNAGDDNSASDGLALPSATPKGELIQLVTGAYALGFTDEDTGILTVEVTEATVDANITLYVVLPNGLVTAVEDIIPNPS